MLHLYTWATPNGRKISIALEEMGLEYKVIPVDITRNEQFQNKYASVLPHKVIPVLKDDSTDVILMESAAILAWLAEKTGQFLPHDETARWEVLQWLFWQAASQGPMLGQAHHFLKFNPGKSEYAEARYGAIAEKLYSQLNARLQNREFIAGDQLSIADFAIWPWTSRFEYQQINLKDYPNVYRWYMALAGREGFRRGYKVPDPAHEIPAP